MRAPQRAARVLRIHRRRLLFARRRCDANRDDIERDQAAPARAGRHVDSAACDHHARRAAGDAAGARADRALRHAACRRRDPRLPGGAGRRHPVHALDHVDLLDRGRGGGGRRSRSGSSSTSCATAASCADLIERAEAAECSALVLTVDLQMHGQRHGDMRNGLTGAAAAHGSRTCSTCHQPAWALAHPATASARPSATSTATCRASSDIKSLAAWTASQFDATLTWKDVEWIRSHLAAAS